MTNNPNPKRSTKSNFVKTAFCVQIFNEVITRHTIKSVNF